MLQSILGTFSNLKSAVTGNEDVAKSSPVSKQTAAAIPDCADIEKDKNLAKNMSKNTQLSATVNNASSIRDAASPMKTVVPSQEPLSKDSGIKSGDTGTCSTCNL